MATLETSILFLNYLVKLKGPDFENNIPYMYIDTSAKVTVGVGHNLTAHQDHLTLPFVVARFERKKVIGGDQGTPIPKTRTAGTAATKDEIKNDFDFLIKHKGLGKYTPENLAPYTTVELPSATIDEIFLKDVTSAIATAKGVLPDIDSYPVPCQAGIVDIVFNTGRLKFPTLVRAVKAEKEFAGKLASERWEAAARESNRPQVKQERNNQVYQWFMAGAAEAKTAEAKKK
jgi:hypothetical protein